MRTMNFFKVVLTLVITFNLNSTKAQKFDNALDYLNYIGEQYEQLTNDQWSYTSAVANDKSAKKVESKRVELLKTNKLAQSKISKMPGYDGNTEYRDSVVAFLKLNYNVLNEDYDKILNMEEIAEQSYDLMEAYLTAQEQASEKIKEASEMLSEVQQKFASDNNITLIENQSKKSQKLEKAGKVYKHYNEVYLIFFKCYKQEMYYLDAMNKGDVNGMEQNNNALLEYAEEGLEKLNNVKAFSGDNSLKDACKDILNFYKNEAKNENPVLIDFFLKKEKFETIQQAFEAKKKNQRTNDDINQFNTSVKEYNEAMNKYNSTNETLNKTRGKKLDNWNNTSSKFTRKHV